MTILRAHFDGRVFVPDEPVDLPLGPVKIHIVEPNTKGPVDRPYDISPKTGLPVFKVSPDANPITMEDVQAALDEPY